MGAEDEPLDGRGDTGRAEGRGDAGGAEGGRAGGRLAGDGSPYPAFHLPITCCRHGCAKSDILLA